jgi:peptidoglycan/xylan/chitin deacetylase (PgdA/CDA1 family)
LKAAILTYHSQNVAGSEASNNDHVALAADLNALHDAGCRFISLDELVNGIGADQSLSPGQPLICLTFDDGCDYDVRDLDFPGHGLQTGFLQIMEAFLASHPAGAQPGLQATSFVIASPQARQQIDQKSLFGRGNISDDWWRSAQAHPLLQIGNHGWDHNHPDLAAEHYARGGFKVIDNFERCQQQVVESGEYIEKQTGVYPVFFAYPFGELSEYISEQYFPSNRESHRCQAAFGTTPGLVTGDSDRWDLPRFVCGRDWSSSSELLAVLGL